MAYSFIAVTPIHDQDADLFLDKYLDNLRLLGFGVAWHFNSISAENVRRCLAYEGTVGHSRRDGVFLDWHRNYALEKALAAKPQYVVTQDADEVFEPEVAGLMPKALRRPAIYSFLSYNVWDEQHVRTDTWCVRRVRRLWPVTGDCSLRWKRAPRLASPILRGPYARVVETPLRMWHWGFSTPELRQAHRDKWAPIIRSRFWDRLLDQSEPVTLERMPVYAQYVPVQTRPTAN